jgi:hypothetical protein
MQELAARLLAKTRKQWFKSVPIFGPHARVSDADLVAVEQKVAAVLPADFKSWLLLVGYGAIDDEICFGSNWFRRVEVEKVEAVIFFAQDALGNYCAFSTVDESVLFFWRSEPRYARLANNFLEFMEELERRDYKLSDWADALEGVSFDSG